MNIQAGKNSAASSRKAKQESQFAKRVAGAAKLIAVLAAAGVIVNSYIYLDQQIAAVNRDIRSCRKSLASTDREIINLRSRCEHLSRWEHIVQMIALHKLQLKLPNPGQVCGIAISPVRPSDAQYVKYTLNSNGSAAR